MKKVIYWILLILWMSVIFIFSNMNSRISDSTSYSIVDKLTYFNEKADNNRDYLNLIVRKSAHFTEFLILGILIYNVFNLYNINNKKKIIFCIIFCLIYAFSDEYHQLFIKGRSAQIKDVFIDFVGSFMGILILNQITQKINHNK